MISVPSLRSAFRRPTRTTTVLLSLMLAVLAPKLYAQARIGLVNRQRAIAETNEGRAALSSIKAQFDRRQTDLEQRGKRLETLKAKLERPPAPVPQARAQKLYEQLQHDAMEYQQLGQQYQQEIQELESQSISKIWSKMQPIVREIGQSGNYEIIVDEAVTHFSLGQMNLTDRVIQLYNQRYPVTAPPPPSAPRATGTAAPRPDPNAARPPLTSTGAANVPATPATGSADAGARGGALPGIFYRRDAGR